MYKKRQFFLFNDILVYGTVSRKQTIFALEDIKLESLEDEVDHQYKNGFWICTKGKSFAVYADTPSDKQNWMSYINKVKLEIKDIRLNKCFSTVKE